DRQSPFAVLRVHIVHHVHSVHPTAIILGVNRRSTMKRIIFGSSGLSVSPIAFGTWQLSPRFWGDQSKKDAIAAMHLAFEKGINFYDTADAYGDGYAETVLGEAIAKLPREEIVICTKFFN